MVITVLAGLDSGKRAELGLSRLGCEYFNPKTVEQRIRRGRKYLQPMQLFPGYIFAKAVEQWRLLLTATGVTGIIRDEDGPLTVSDTIVEQLRRDQDSIPTGIGPVQRFRPGQAVFLMAGSFVDKVVIFEGMRGEERCAVLMQMLGRQTRVVVDECTLAEII